MEFFKEGQIVPKRISKGFIDLHNKARHTVKFGADCKVFLDGDAIVIESSNAQKPAIKISRIGRKMSNGTVKMEPSHFRNLHFITTSRLSLDDAIHKSCGGYAFTLTA